MTAGCEWRHALEAWAEIWEKSVSWDLASEEEGWLLLARRGFVSGAHVVWVRWKSQVYLSRYVEKPLNSKVIKTFVPELRSRKSFCGSGFLCYLYMSYIHFTNIRISGYVTKCCVTHFNVKNPPCRNMIKNLVYGFKLVLEWQSTHNAVIAKLLA